jgi:DNA (cytosine-5)-methyltransferase 1
VRAAVTIVKDLEPIGTTEGGTAPPGSVPVVVSLFSGAGGLDLGFRQAGFKIGIAFDSSASTIATHRHNFRRTKAVHADLVEIGAAGVLADVATVVPAGNEIGIIGGPPCQGFSRANRSVLHDDPRNHLAGLYVEIVRELRKNFAVRFVVFENVLGIRDQRNRPTYQALVDGLTAEDLEVSQFELCAADFGVAQRRRRVVVVGVDGAASPVSEPRTSRRSLTVRDAIGSIRLEPAFFEPNLDPAKFEEHENHWTMRPVSKRFSQPGGARVDGRSFKRLEWTKSSPTIAFGHREIHVHPDGHRRISIYEALLLQGFPRSFVLKGNLSEQAEQVSNAVPPPMARSIATAVYQSLR